MADLATERERQLTTARANQTTGLSNGKTAIGHRKSCLVLSARFPVANLRSRPVAKSAYYSKASAAAFVVLFVVIINVIIVFHVRKSFTVTVVSCCFVQHQNTEKRGKDFSKITKFSLLLIHCNDLIHFAVGVPL